MTQTTTCDLSHCVFAWPGTADSDVKSVENPVLSESGVGQKIALRDMPEARSIIFLSLNKSEKGQMIALHALPATRSIDVFVFNQSLV